MRLVARAWEQDCCCHVEEVGMVRGKAAPTTFHNAATGTRCVVLGDSFAFVATDDAADEGLVPYQGTRGPGKWSKRRHGRIVAQQVGESEVWLHRGSGRLQTPPVIIKHFHLNKWVPRAHGACHQGRRWRRRTQTNEESMGYRGVAARATRLAVDRPGRGRRSPRAPGLESSSPIGFGCKTSRK